MAGQQFFDVEAMGTSALGKGPKSVTRHAADQNGVPLISVKGAISVPLAQYIAQNLGAFYSTSFESETLGIAQTLMPDREFNRSCGTDFTPIWGAALSAAGTPVYDLGAPPPSAFGGGVVRFTGVAGQLALNPVTPGAATYNPLLGAFDSSASPWLIRARVLINAQAFTAATSIVFCSLDGSGVSGGGATHRVQLLTAGSTHAQQTFVQLQNASGTGPLVSTGPDGLFGGANGLFQPNNWTTITLYFDGINIRWMFQDQFNPNNYLDALGITPGVGNMDFMPNDATSVTLQCTDTTVGPNFFVDALAFAYCAPTGNR